jgi:hypothetical protein
MAARRCLSCGICFPSGSGDCDACGGTTTWDPSATPHEDWASRVEAAKYEPTLEERKLRSWRERRLTQMGFEGAFLDVLAGTPAVRLHDVEALLARGCSHDDAARILL